MVQFDAAALPRRQRKWDMQSDEDVSREFAPAHPPLAPPQYYWLLGQLLVSPPPPPVFYPLSQNTVAR